MFSRDGIWKQFSSYLLFYHKQRKSAKYIREYSKYSGIVKSPYKDHESSPYFIERCFGISGPIKVYKILANFTTINITMTAQRQTEMRFLNSIE